MKPLNLLTGSGLLFGATTAVIAGHDVLARQLYLTFADGGLAGASRIASPTAALLVHMIAGIFVLPLLRRARAVSALPDAGRLAMATALVAVTLRTVAEMATGVIVAGLPIFSMAAVSAGVAVASSLRGVRRSRAGVAAPRLVRDLQERRSDAA